MRVQFDDLIFDAEARQLWVAEREVRLSPKAFDLLALLIVRRPRAVSKDDINKTLWPGTFVSGSSLPSLISEIREAIVDHRRKPGLIRTVHGFGYAFRAEQPTVSPMPPTSATGARLIGSETEIWLAAGENIVGREGHGIVIVKSSTVSRRHARIVVDVDGSIVEDLGSKNGTYVNDRRVSGSTPVANGDHLRIGSLLFTFRIARGDDSTQTTSSPTSP